MSNSVYSNYQITSGSNWNGKILFCDFTDWKSEFAVNENLKLATLTAWPFSGAKRFYEVFIISTVSSHKICNYANNSKQPTIKHDQSTTSPSRNQRFKIGPSIRAWIITFDRVQTIPSTAAASSVYQSIKCTNSSLITT